MTANPAIADLVIVGAGPAGMAAAVLADILGLATVLLDEQDSPGGQIYRAIEHAGANGARPSPLGADYLAGRPLTEALRASRVQYRPGTTVWHIEPSGEAGASADIVKVSVMTAAGSETIAARRLLLAVGAIERPVPIPGWTLPGVMTAGAAQIMLKTADLVPDGRTVLAGQGPLLYLAALQLARAGAPPLLVLDTTPRENYAAALRHAGSWWAGRRDLGKGLAMIAALRRHGVPVRRGVRGLRAGGRRRLEGVAWNGGEAAADLLLLHDGVIPNAQISLALQLAHVWDEAQLCWRPVADEWGGTSLPTVSVAGDAAGIAGAAAAALTGRLAALDAACRLGRIDGPERDRRAAPLRADLARERALRRFLDRLYRPADTVLCPADDVIVCRCEEITAGRIRRAVQLGAQGPNQVKAFIRCGMGPCQGRLCGPVASAVIARARGIPVAEVGTFRPRAPYKPITVGALAGLAPPPTTRTEKTT
jgi:NADPH-dependent 2,4-dienoyl-CoA reductase/sulfur reductase-like enzyme